MKRVVLLTLFMAAAILAIAVDSGAGVPELINYQGRLTDSTGALDSSYFMKFTIWNDSVASNPENELWTSGIRGVQVQSGLFTYVLGDTVPFPDNLFSFDTTGRYLGVKVGFDNEMPRTRLISAPYALYSLRSDSAGFAGAIANNTVTSLKIVNGAILFEDIGQNGADSGKIMKWNGASWEAVLDEAGGGGGGGGWTDDGSAVRLETASDSVGIGTSTPSEKLDVSGGIRSSGDLKVLGKATVGTSHLNVGAGAFIGGGADDTTYGQGAFIAGGGSNKVTKDFGFAAGFGNLVSGRYSTVNGGRDNQASEGDFMGPDAGYSTVGGGRDNLAGLDYTTVSGGQGNIAIGSFTSSSGGHSTVGGGQDNLAANLWATISGGQSDTVLSRHGTIGGGYNNIITGGDTARGATIGGGAFNRARGAYSVVSGGGGDVAWDSNAALGDWSAIVGGRENLAAGTGSFIGAGQANYAAGDYSFVGGGDSSRATNTYAVVTGGSYNTASGQHSFIGGGDNNTARGQYSFVGGGVGHDADSTWATVGGGYINTARSEYSTVGGGANNTAGAFGYGAATVSGGANNTASGQNSSVPGGAYNVAAGDYSFAAGYKARALHQRSFVWSGSSDSAFTTADNQFLISANGGVGINTFSPDAPLEVLGMIHSSLNGFQFPDGTIQTTAAGGGTSGWTDDGSAVRLETSSDSVGIGTSTPSAKLDVAGTVKMDGFMMPNGVITGYVMTADSAGTGTWQEAPGGGGNDNDWYVGTGNNDVLFTFGRWGIAREGNTLYGVHDSTHVNLGGNNTTGTNGQDFEYCTVGGGKSNTASGTYATVSGGQNNTADSLFATVSGGTGNVAIDHAATVSGGQGNTADSSFTTVGGGAVNTASNYAATVSGGQSNIASGRGATVSGGELGVASGNRATVSGGYSNVADSGHSTVSGGLNNTASGTYATVSGGQYNTSSGSNATVSGGRYNTSSALHATVSGGVYDTASGYASSVSGGVYNTAAGDYSFAAGFKARALHQGSFVWSGYSSSSDSAYTTADNQFLISANGGVGINTFNPVSALDVAGDIHAYGGVAIGTTGFTNGAKLEVSQTASGAAFSNAVRIDMQSTSGAGPAFGINVSSSAQDSAYGLMATAADAKFGVGVYGEGLNDTVGYGVKGLGLYWGTGPNTANYGVYGAAANAASGEFPYNYGIYGVASGYGSNYAGYFNGDTHVNGVFTAAAKFFKIDHPLDPQNKYLRHSCVESSEMLNVYSGVVTLDSRGEAAIQMSDYFEALNTDFRYQLTPIGAPGPNLHIANEVSDNSFSIAGGEPGMKVSWQVSGVRHDAYAKANPIQTEEDKPEHEIGTYLHPEAHGVAPELGLHYEDHERLSKQLERGGINK